MILIELVLAALRQPTRAVLSRPMLLCLVQPTVVLLAVHRHRHGALRLSIDRRHAGTLGGGAFALFGGAICLSRLMRVQRPRRG